MNEIAAMIFYMMCVDQMGFEPGKGLGKKSQGITVPVEAVQRKGTRATLGYYGQERPASAYKDVVDSDEEEAKEFKEQLQQWKKQPEVTVQQCLNSVVGCSCMMSFKFGMEMLEADIHVKLWQLMNSQ